LFSHFVDFATLRSAVFYRCHLTICALIRSESTQHFFHDSEPEKKDALSYRNCVLLQKLDDAPLIGQKLTAESKNVYVVGEAIGRGGYGRCCITNSPPNHFFQIKPLIKVLKLGDGFFHFVKLIDQGLLPDDGQQFFVMELLWKNLSELQRLMPTKRFSLSTAIRCSMQIYLIDFGIARKYIDHNGAVKPRRLVGAWRGTARYCSLASHFKQVTSILRDDWLQNKYYIYLIDFGIARKYIDHNGAVKPRRLVGAWRGTARYCSLASHFKQVTSIFRDDWLQNKYYDQCRRDDVECWFYMTIEFIKGKLPWSEISKYERDEIAKKKQSLRTSEREAILGECPDGWNDILDIIDSCEFEAVPEYDTVVWLICCCLHHFVVHRLHLYLNHLIVITKFRSKKKALRDH
uniref:Protein kinase domain-containing protein n=1 Tax=Ascaris lumbricoides TaxID=6252 RepID=A0A0M3IDU8_ASCLU